MKNKIKDEIVVLSLIMIVMIIGLIYEFITGVSFVINNQHINYIK